jgi:hypothetical protein
MIACARPGFLFPLILTAVALGQSADITGWSNVRWGATTPVARKSLNQLGARECNRNTDALCAEASGPGLAIEKYNLNGVTFKVNLLFTANNGLTKVILTAEDKRDAFEKMLSQLNNLYGKPGLQSEYEGVEELTHTTWTWMKTHGKVNLDSEEGSGVFTITYEARLL